MRALFRWASLSALLISPLVQAAGSVEVQFVQADKFTDAGRGSFDTQHTLKVLGDHLKALGRQLPDGQTLQIDVTIEDPKAYTEPFTVRVMQQLMPDTELFESVCEDRDAVHYLGDLDAKQKSAGQK